MWGVIRDTPAPNPKILEKAHRMLKDEEGKLLIDSFVTHCGDDLELIMTHSHGVDNEQVHKLAWDVFMECTKIAKSMKLYVPARTCSPPHSPAMSKGSVPVSPRWSSRSAPLIRC